MRFVLDHDVDVEVGRVLRRAGHDCWTAAVAGRVDDDDVSVYADERAAVVVTHDKEFTGRRKGNTFGQHVHLACSHPDAVDLVKAKLGELEERLTEVAVGVFVVSERGVEVHQPKWE